MEQGKIRIDVIVLLAIPMACAHEPDVPQILELSADGIDLLMQQPREFTNEILLFGMEEKCREELHARLRTKQCFKNHG